MTVCDYVKEMKKRQQKKSDNGNTPFGAFSKQLSVIHCFKKKFGHDVYENAYLSQSKWPWEGSEVTSKLNADRWAKGVLYKFE